MKQRISQSELTEQGDRQIESVQERREETRKMVEDFHRAGEIANTQADTVLQETADALNRLNEALGQEGRQEVEQQAEAVDVQCEEMAAHEQGLEGQAGSEKEAAESIAAGRRGVESDALNGVLGEQQAVRERSAEVFETEEERIRDTREESERDVEQNRDSARSIADALRDF